MKNIGSTLKQLREKNGFTRREVAEKLTQYGFNISDKTIYGYESGRSSANADMFLALCKVYKCTDILNTFEDTTNEVLFTNSEWEFMKQYHDLDVSGKDALSIALGREKSRIASITKKDQRIAELEARLIPRYFMSYYQRLASAGTGEYLFEDIPTDTIEVPANETSEQADFVIGVTGDSMEPTYHDGDKVYVRKQPTVEVGEIGIFIRDNECLIKEAGEKGLISHNKKYPVIPGAENIQCVGKVLGKINDKM